MSDSRDERLPDLRYVRELARVFKQYDLDEVEIETGEQRILLRRGGAEAPTVVSAPVAAAPVAAPAVVEASAEPAPAVASETGGEFITSPFVGTFYTSPNPDAPAFVKRGDSVAKGQTVCIVEAMKLFNEIEAEFPCVIEEILVEAGQPVEFGAKLFRVSKL
ncbi:MAG: acetyl-CoA carboxylase biotin carboxyl carrier protein [Myxococcales bacterium FL481]|nr:MAG: acetyl-CoA carboxylase biotin carboxyl carrier protein [Myxococcales bacterium FL481]